MSSFQRLIESSDPWRVLDQQGWDELGELVVREKKLQVRVFEYSDRLDLNWPQNRSEERLGSYLCLSLEQLRQMAGIGQGKRDVLLRCILHACRHNSTGDLPETTGREADEPQGPLDGLFFSLRRAMRSRYPWKVLKNEEWDTMRAALMLSPACGTAIVDVAIKLNLKWPNTRRAEKLADYCGYTIDEVSNLGGFGRKKLRTLGRVMIWSYLDNSVEGFQSAALSADEMDELDWHERLAGVLSQFLSDREKDVLERRIGIRHSGRQTLAELGGAYGLTRERVRQIELKAYRKCRTPWILSTFSAYLDSHTDLLISIVLNGKEHLGISQAPYAEQQLSQLLPSSLLCIHVAHGGFAAWLDECLHPIGRGKSKAGWIRPGLSSQQIESLEARLRQRGDDWSERIRQQVLSMNWPVSVAALSERLPHLPESALTVILQEELEADIRDGRIVSLKRLTAASRLIYVLRKAGRGLHLSEVRAWHFQMFGSDISEQSIGNTLARLPEVLIVERGVYDLYENLPMGKEDIAQINDRIYGFVKSMGDYVSSKVILNKAFAERDSEFGFHFSHYFILGCAQDDARFDVRRGLMVGLSEDGFTEKFKGLKETVERIVLEHGPVNVGQISKHLSTRRLVPDSSIGMALRDSDQIVACGRREFDCINKVLGPQERVESLSDAIEINLLDGPASFFSLHKRLRGVGLDLDRRTVYSFLQKLDNVEVEDQLIYLKSPSAPVRRYHQLFQQQNQPSESPGTLKQAPSLHERSPLAALDYRRHQTEALEPEGSGEDLLGDLIAEFDF